MKRLIWLLALCVGLSLSALAQSSGSSTSGSSSPSASQGSSSSGSSDQATTSKKSKKSKESGMAGKEHTVTGCLSGPNDEGVYVLTNGRYKKGLEVGGNDDLKSHVGHEVKLTGTWASESDINEKAGTEKNEGKTEAKEKHMKVTKIDHIADSCTSAKAGKGKSKKEKGSSSTSTPPSM